MAICTELAKEARNIPGEFLSARIRNLIAGGYYTTPIGMKDVGYVGNVAMVEWNGLPAEVLKILDLSAE